MKLSDYKNLKGKKDKNGMPCAILVKETRQIDETLGTTKDVIVLKLTKYNKHTGLLEEQELYDMDINTLLGRRGLLEEELAAVNLLIADYEGLNANSL